MEALPLQTPLLLEGPKWIHASRKKRQISGKSDNGHHLKSVSGASMKFCSKIEILERLPGTWVDQAPPRLG